jgi:hypothetical protein
MKSEANYFLDKFYSPLFETIYSLLLHWVYMPADQTVFPAKLDLRP